MKGRYQGTSEEASEQSTDGNAGKEGEKRRRKELRNSRYIFRLLSLEIT